MNNTTISFGANGQIYSGVDIKSPNFSSTFKAPPSTTLVKSVFAPTERLAEGQIVPEPSNRPYVFKYVQEQ